MTTLRDRDGMRSDGVRGMMLAVCLGLLFPLAWVGCKDDPGPPASPAQKKVVRVRPPSTPAAPATEARQQAPADLLPLKEPDAEAEEDGYRPRSKRDPFRSFVKIRPRVDVAEPKRPAKPLTPLQRYGLDQLSVVGIISGAVVDRALLEDDAGKGYVVGVGDDVGDRGGVIAAIKEDRIVIEEKYRDPLGKELTRTIVKRLYPAQEGQNP